MAFIPLSNGFRVALEYSLNGQLVVNVYHVTSTLPVNTTNLAVLANVFINWWSTNMRQNFTNQIALNRVVATDIRVQNGQQLVQPVTTNNAGTIASTTAPNNVAFVISERTGLAGRSFRGRHYYAGISASEIADNALSGTYVTNVLADAQSLLSALSTAGFVWVVASFYANNAPRAVGVATPINAFIVDNRVDTQRRRLPGTGE